MIPRAWPKSSSALSLLIAAARSDRAKRVSVSCIRLTSAQRCRPSGVLGQFDWDNCVMAITNPQLLLSTAGGRICCARCTAQSSRTKLQCGRPALKTSKTQKCQFHGARSSGQNGRRRKTGTCEMWRCDGQSRRLHRG